MSGHTLKRANHVIKSLLGPHGLLQKVIVLPKELIWLPSIVQLRIILLLVSCVYYNYNHLFLDLAQPGNTGTSDHTDQKAYIGLYTETDDNSDYIWSDGSPVDYTNWEPGQPDAPGRQKCGSMYANGQFDNIECTTSLKYSICKKPAIQVNL